MVELSKRLDELGDAVAEVDARTAKPGTLAKARRRFLSYETRRSAAPHRRLALTVVAAVCCACVLLIAHVGLNRRATTTFVVGPSAAIGTVGEWVAAEGSEPLAMRFSDGSALSLEPGTRMRVTETTADGAVVLVEQGTVHAEIKHAGPSTAWRLRAGPFAVQVTGTRFAAAWEPSTETLDLLVDEGSVVVNGPLLGPERTVAAGERLLVSVRAQRMELSKGIAPPGGSASADPATPHGSPASGGSRPSSPGETSAGTRAAASPGTQPSGAGGAGVASEPAATSATGGASAASAAAGSGPSWRELSAARKYREAWRELEKQGVDPLIESASSGELLALADTARFVGEAARAQQALLALRRRFGAKGYSAFLLGRISADQLSSPGQGVQWFETYLQEEPNGALAEQALGRILDIQRHGSPAAARQAAERYLARFPSGAYAAMARSLIGP
jgi:hypothetical protein